MYVDKQHIDTGDPETTGWYCQFVYARDDETLATQFGPFERISQMDEVVMKKTGVFWRLEENYGKGRIATRPERHEAPSPTPTSQMSLSDPMDGNIPVRVYWDGKLMNGSTA